MNKATTNALRDAAALNAISALKVYDAMAETDDINESLASTASSCASAAQDLADAAEDLAYGIADIQATWASDSLEAANIILDATIAQTGLTGLTYDNFLESFNDAVGAGMDNDALDDWGRMSDAIRDVEDAVQEAVDAIDEQTQIEIDALNTQISFFEGILGKIDDAYLGSLSYLTTSEKEAYSAQAAERYLGEGDTTSYLDALAESLKYAKETSVTKEDYMPAFNEYIDALKLAEPEATTDDVVDELAELNAKVDKLADAIERAAFQQ